MCETFTLVKIANMPITLQRFLLSRQFLLPLPIPVMKQLLVCLLPIWITFSRVLCNWNIEHVPFFWSGIFWLHIILLMFICVCINNSFIYFGYYFLCMAMPQFIKSVNRHLGCFQFGLSTDKAAVSICVHILVGPYVPFLLDKYLVIAWPDYVLVYT